MRQTTHFEKKTNISIKISIKKNSYYEDYSYEKYVFKFMTESWRQNFHSKVRTKQIKNYMHIIKQQEYEIRSCSSVIKNLFLFFLTYEYLRRVVGFTVHLTKTIISIRFHGHFSIFTFPETELDTRVHCYLNIRKYFLYNLRTCFDSYLHMGISISKQISTYYLHIPSQLIKH